MEAEFSEREALALTLQQRLPPHLQPYSVELAQVLLEALSSKEPQITFENQLKLNPSLEQAIEILRGQRVTVPGTTVDFGSNTQTGDITIRDIAGRDIINLNIAVKGRTQDRRKLIISLIVAVVVLLIVAVFLNVSSFGSNQRVVFSETFDEKHASWVEGTFSETYATWNWQVIDGVYRLTMETNQNAELDAEIPNLTRRTFDLRFEATILEMAKRTAIITDIRRGEEGFYRISFDSNNDYSIFYFTFSDNSWSKVESGPLDARINIFKEVKNVYQIKTTSNNLEIRVNNLPLTSLPIREGIEAGEVRIGAETLEGPDRVVVSFDNIAVRAVD